MMSSRPARERLALFIQSLGVRQNANGHDEEEPVALFMTRVELGNYLALASETVSRLLSELQSTGVIELQRRSLRIRDMERLIDLSGEDLRRVRDLEGPAISGG